MIAPACHAVELSAIARGSRLRGTRLGASALKAGPANARATPSSAATANRIGRLISPLHVAEPQDQRAGQLEAEHGTGDVAAVEAIGRPAADRRQDEQGHELEQADQAELEGGVADAHGLAGDVIDLPADDDDHRHLRDGAGQARQPKGPERRNPERFGEDAHGRRPNCAPTDRQPARPTRPGLGLGG